jgi:acyl-CoA thioester hydrolase
MPIPFTTIRRVEFGDTDMAGIMHFGNFFRFMEVAETDFLRARGLTVAWIENGVKYGFPRVSAACDYRAPARFGDVLTIAVAIEKVGTKSVSFRFEFTRDGTTLATGRITSVYCRQKGDGMESLPIPQEIRERIES